MDTGLADRVVMVTGASGGIGASLVPAFVQEGCRVIAQFHHNAETARALAVSHSRVVALGADLCDETAVELLFVEAEEHCGAASVLVANAGFWPPDPVPLHQLTLHRWQTTLSNNLTSVFLSIRAFLRRVERQRIEEPSIVLIGSTAGQFGEAGHADYATAKAALVGLMKSVKNEITRIAPQGRINLVAPGWTLTAAKKATVFSHPENVRRTLQTRALRQLAAPEDVARAAVFLASPQLARHITGEVLTVSGGMEGRVLYTPEEIDPSRL